MKKLIVFVLFVLIYVVLPGKEISYGEAEMTAHHWAAMLCGYFKEDVEIAPGEGREITIDGLKTAYVFSFEPKGFVVIPARGELPAVKFYTTTFDFDEHEKARDFQRTLFRGLNIMVENIKKKEEKGNTGFGTGNRETWRLIRNEGIIQEQTEPVKEISPMISSRWGQTGAENLKCPTMEGMNHPCPAGCVAIVYAQVMNYHEWPLRGRGSNTYFSAFCNLILTVDFDHPYDWDVVRDEYKYQKDGTPEQIDAISTLVYDVAVALEMHFNRSWSSTDDRIAQDSLPRYFRYSPAIKKIFRGDFTGQEWADIIKEQFERGLPVVFGIDNFDYGHKVVTDGYRKVGDIEHFHINFGWSGKYDGFYALDNIDEFLDIPGQDLVFNIYPPNYRHILPPQNIQARAYENRSLLQTEYHIQVTWDESPTGDQNLDSYIIYRRNAYEPEKMEKLAVLPATSPHAYTFITPTLDSRKYEYTVIAIAPHYNKSKNPTWTKIREN